jgi:hypothetical protein
MEIELHHQLLGVAVPPNQKQDAAQRQVGRAVVARLVPKPLTVFEDVLSCDQDRKVYTYKVLCRYINKDDLTANLRTTLAS